jgi:hypothetical protein
MTDTTETAATPEVAQPAKKEKKAKPAEKQQEKKPRELKGMMVSLKRAIIADPEMDIDALLAKLKGEGFTPSRSSVATIAADFRHSCRVLDDAGIKGLKAIIK